LLKQEKIDNSPAMWLAIQIAKTWLVRPFSIPSWLAQAIVFNSHLSSGLELFEKEKWQPQPPEKPKFLVALAS
jgi:hypothetical protein